MPLIYTGPTSGQLRQGEILADIYEHRADRAPVELPPDALLGVKPRRHPRVIVMTAECDLEWDYKRRCVSALDEGHQKIVPYVLLCDVFSGQQIQHRFDGAALWTRVEKNLDERYHRLDEAPIGDPELGRLPELYLDFKKTFALPTLAMYAGFFVRGIRREAVVPTLYLQNLMHRFYSFLSRVGLPD